MLVEIYIDMSKVGFQISTFQMDAVAASTIGLFTNSSMLRKSIRIQLWSCSERSVETTPIGLIRVLKNLIGFANVTIEIESVFRGKQELVQACYAADSGEQIVYECLVPRKIRPEMMKYEIPVWLAEREVQWAAAWLEKMRNALETALRPSTSGDVEGAHNVVFARYLEFLPQQYQAILQFSKSRDLSDSVEGISLAKSEVVKGYRKITNPAIQLSQGTHTDNRAFAPARAHLLSQSSFANSGSQFLIAASRA